MKQVFLLLAALATTSLAGCGVDGEPTTPEAKTTPGVSITGRAEIGVAKRS